MKVTIEIELQPFQVPDHALAVSTVGRRQDGMQPVAKYPLSDLDPRTLERMCDVFKAEIFRKAGKNMPPQAIRSE